MAVRKKLDNIYGLYQSLIQICDAAIERSKRDWSFTIEVISPKAPKKKQNKNKLIDDHFDTVKSKIEELYILDLITTFEQIMFEKIINTSGEIKKMVKYQFERRLKDYNNNNQKKDKSIALVKSAVSFIKNKEDIHNLSGAKKIIENQMKSEFQSSASVFFTSQCVALILSISAPFNFAQVRFALRKFASTNTASIRLA